MISVDDLIVWCESHAIGRSASFTKGWITGKDLTILAADVLSKEADYEESRKVATYDD